MRIWKRSQILKKPKKNALKFYLNSSTHKNIRICCNFLPKNCPRSSLLLSESKNFPKSTNLCSKRATSTPKIKAILLAWKPCIKVWVKDPKFCLRVLLRTTTRSLFSLCQMKEQFRQHSWVFTLEMVRMWLAVAYHSRAMLENWPTIQPKLV